MKMVLKLIVLALIVLSQGMQSARAQCNGDPSLCAKRYDEVCYATTHNAFNYQGAFILPNQSYDIARQMQDGVRGLMLDVYWFNNRPTVYHGSNFLGNQPLSDLLDDIKTFLDANPTDVVTIIFECYITASQMNDVFSSAGLLSYVHTQSTSTPWPTLGDMIAANRRLVVFTDANDGAAYPWYHHVWDFAVETDYSAQSRSDFSCAYNRGDSSNSLFILNHFVTAQGIGTGIIDSALAINSQPYLLDRASNCWAATGKRPNFLTVDFYEQGDVMATRDSLNHLTQPVTLDPTQPEGEGIEIGPNPAQDFVGINSKEEGMFTLYNIEGRTVLQEHLSSGYNRILLPQALRNGMYCWQMQSHAKRLSGKLLISHR